MSHECGFGLASLGVVEHPRTKDHREINFAYDIMACYKITPTNYFSEIILLFNFMRYKSSEFF